jgi:lysophospholipase L1-like esterase
MTLQTLRRLSLSAATLLLLPTLAHAKPKPAPDHWVATWSTASVGVAVKPSSKPGVFTPGAADTTLRQIVHVSLGGKLVRLEFTNAFGTEPLTLAEVHIALADNKVSLTGTPSPNAAPTGDISLISANALTFAGASSVTIPAGAEAISDPVALNLPPEADLVISIFLPAQKISIETLHQRAEQTNFEAPGNLVREQSLTSPASALAPGALLKTVSWYFLKSVDVQDPANTATIVAFGDSITDGYASTLDAKHRWPDDLAHRLQADPQTQNLAVINEGISGNRILREGNGPSALARFNRDVLSQPGVRYVILFEGINDIGHAFDSTIPYDPVTLDQLTGALTQLAEQAHTHGLKVFGASLTPYLGAKYASPAGEQVREALNQWIRTTPTLDGVLDFDKATESPSNPNTFNPAYDCGDHLHPNDAGLQAMANAINLQLFYPPKK